MWENLRDNTIGPIVAKYGVSAQIIRHRAGTYNVSAGEVVGGGNSTYTCDILIEEFDQSAIDGTNILYGDKLLLISAKGLDTTPQIGDTIILQDGRWTVPDTRSPVKIIAPAGIALAYEVQVRK